MTEEVKDRATGSEENRPYQNGTYARHTAATKEDKTAEDVLETFAKIVRGFLCALAVVVYIACLYIGYVSMRGDLLFWAAVGGLVVGAIIVILAYLFWARIQVIVNISLTLKKINSKMK